jgi:hypothetical protein
MAGTLTIATLSDGTNSTSSTNCIQGSAKAWVQFVGATAVRNASYNVSSVTRNAAGDYTINFTNAFADAFYTTNINGGATTGGSWFGFVVPNAQAGSSYYQAPTTSAFRFVTSTSSAGGSNGDPLYVSVACFR